MRVCEMIRGGGGENEMEVECGRRKECLKILNLGLHNLFAILGRVFFGLEGRCCFSKSAIESRDFHSGGKILSSFFLHWVFFS